MKTYQDWVKRLGQWHLCEKGEYRTLCGKPMLGNNYASEMGYEDRTKCPECFDAVRKIDLGQERR